MPYAGHEFVQGPNGQTSFDPIWDVGGQTVPTDELKPTTMSETPNLKPISEDEISDGRVVYTYPDDWRCPKCGASRVRVDQEYAQCQGYGCKQWFKVEDG